MKIAIVTGASSGMGRETILQIAVRFKGIQEIWAIARRGGRLEELQERISVPLRVLPLDLCQAEALTVLKDTLKQQKPDVKILVNAAGYGKIGAVGTVPPDEETGMVRLNCEALCGVTSAVLPYISPNSRIIQFASSAAFLPQPDFAIYAATKSFVLSYSRALNEELRNRRITVTAVCPGPVRTEFFNIAETTQKMSAYKELVMADPQKVVRLALRDATMGKSVSVYGPIIKAFRFLCKVLPHGLLLRIADCMYERK